MGERNHVYLPEIIRFVGHNRERAGVAHPRFYFETLVTNIFKTVLPQQVEGVFFGFGTVGATRKSMADLLAGIGKGFVGSAVLENFLVNSPENFVKVGP